MTTFHSRRCRQKINYACIIMSIICGLFLFCATSKIAYAQPTAVASSVQDNNPQYVASNAIDGNMSTRWASSWADSEWIYVDYETPRDFNLVTLHWEAAYGKVYQIQISNDATNWTTVYTENNGNGGVDEIYVGPRNARYVKMQGVQRGSSYGYSLWEIEVTSVTKRAFASTVQSSLYDANKAVDDDLNTRWASAADSDPQWIYADFLTPKYMNRVVLRWETAYAKSYRIQISDDAVNWTDIYSTTSGDGGVDEIFFNAVTARYVRMYGTERGLPYAWAGYSLYEFETYYDNSPRAMASSVQDNNPQYVASNAIDSNMSTRWASNWTHNEWIFVDYIVPQVFNTVTLNWDLAYGDQYDIQVSDNGQNWITVYSTVTGDGGTDEIYVGNQNKQYVRMLGHHARVPWSPNEQYGYSLFEIAKSTTDPIPTAEASSIQDNAPQYAASNVIDGDMATRWASDWNNNEWIVVDYKQPQSFNAVSLYWDLAYGKAYEIQVSNDNVNWTTVYSESYGDGGIDKVYVGDQTARYLKMQGVQATTAWGDNFGYSLWEIGITTMTPEEIATPTAKASSVQDQSPDYAADKVIDGDLNTRWASDWSDPQWIYVDLKQHQNVNKVTLNWEYLGYAKSYRIQVSTDAATWTTVYSTALGNGGIDVITFPTEIARYVRMYSTERGSTYGYSLYEFQIEYDAGLDEGLVKFGLPSYSGTSEEAIIIVDDPGLNTDPNLQETVTVDVTSTSDTNGISLFLTEQSNNSRYFTSQVTGTNLGFSKSKSDNIGKIIWVADRDTITATYHDYDPLQNKTATATWYDSENMALGKITGASSVEANDPNLVAQNVTDGKMNTKWASDWDDSEWIYIDLGIPRYINKVILSWEAAYGKSYEIQVSNDAVNWQAVYTTAQGSGGTDIITFPTTLARYVRMYGTERGTTYGYSLWEFGVYYVPSSIDLDRENYTRQTEAVITVIDQDLNLNLNLQETVNISVTSTSDPSGITMMLTEQGFNSSAFTSSATGVNLGFSETASDDTNEIIKVSDADLITVGYNDLMPPEVLSATANWYISAVNFDQEDYSSLLSKAVVTVFDADLNSDPATQQTATVTVTSGSDPVGITLILTEENVNSSIFTTTATGKDLGFSITASDDVNEVIKVSQGDTVTARYSDVSLSLYRTDTATMTSVSNLTAREVINLNGTWEVEPGPQNTPPSSWTHTIPVPGLMDLAVPDIDMWNNDYFWYKKTFTLTPEQNNGQAYIRIGLAKYGTEVFLNGVSLGSYMGAYTSHEYDATGIINYNGENTLLVRVGDRRTIPVDATGAPLTPIGIDYEKWPYYPGIWGDVTLVLTGTSRIVNVQMIPKIDSNLAEAKVILKNRQSTSQNINLSLQVLERESSRVASGEITESYVLSANEERTVTLSIPLDNMQLWSPETPFLYKLVARLSQAGVEIDSFTVHFGMREFKVVGKDFYLNGQRRLLRGGNMAFMRFLSDPDRGTLVWNEDWIRQVVATIPKANNMNTFRVHLGHMYDKWYDIADEEGIMFEEEWAFWLEPTGSYEDIKAEFTQWVKDNWNHPSIIIWDIINEQKIDIPEARLDQLVEDIKAIDATRPVEYGFVRRFGDFFEQHIYVYSSDAVMWPDLIDYVNDFTEPLVINECIWFWMMADYVPTIITTQIERRWLGEDITTQMRIDHQDFLAQEIVEFYRRLDADGIMPFVYLNLNKSNTANWFTGNIADLNPKPVLNALKNAFSPFGVSIEVWDRHFFVNEGRAIDVYVFNDHPYSKSGTLNCTIVDENDNLVASIASIPVSAAPVNKEIISVNWTMPATTGTYYLKAELTQDGEPAVSKKIIHVLNEPQAPSNLSTANIMVYDPDAEISDYLSSLGLNITDFVGNSLNGQDILVVGEGALTDSYYNSRLSEVTSFVQSGHSLVIIEPSFGITEDRSIHNTTPNPVYLTNDTSLEVILLKDEDKLDRQYDSYVFKRNKYKSHPVWANIEDAHLKMFNGATGAEMVSEHEVLPNKENLVLAACGNMLEEPVIMEALDGSGIVVVSRVELRGRLTEAADPGTGFYNRRVDPIARQLLLNLLSTYLNVNDRWQSIRNDLDANPYFVANVVASSEEEPRFYRALRAIDGVDFTEWRSSWDDPQWIYVDLGEQKTVNRVILKWGDNAWAKAYQVQISNDAVSWSDVYSTDNGDGGIDDVVIAPVNARFVRMYATESDKVANPNYPLWNFDGYFLKAFEVYNYTGGIEGRVELDLDIYSGNNDEAIVTLWDLNLNTDPNSQETAEVTVTSTIDPAGITLVLTENGINSTEFNSNVTGTNLKFSKVNSDNITKIIKVSDGDTVTVTYQDASPAGVRTDTAIWYDTDNIALGKQTVASSVEGAPYPSSSAVDHDMTTRWSSQHSDPQWLYVDLGKKRFINKVILRWEAAFGKSYQIQVSDDANNWTTVYSTTSGDGGIDEIYFASVETRYVRLYGTERGTGYGYSLWEFEIFYDRYLIDNFEDDQPNINSRAFSTGDNGTCAVNQDIDKEHKVRWDNLDDYWYSVLWDGVNYMDADENDHLSFKIKGELGQEQFKVELEDSAASQALEVTNYTTIYNIPRRVDIPLKDFSSLDKSALKKLTFRFSTANTGIIIFDDIRLIKIGPFDCWIEYTNPTTTRSDGLPVYYLGDTVTYTVHIRSVADEALNNLTVEAIHEYYETDQNHNEGDPMPGNSTQTWYNQSLAGGATLDLNGSYAIPYNTDGGNDRTHIRIIDGQQAVIYEKLDAGVWCPPPVAVASSIEGPGLEPDRAIDNNMSTRWSSAWTDNEWIYLDYGKQIDFVKVSLFWETAYGKQYEIQISNNATNWTTVYTENNSNGADDIIYVGPQNARYIKVQGIQRGTTYGYSLHEFRVSNDATTAVSSSDESDVLTADKAIDNDMSTRWSSQHSDNEWIYVDFGVPKTFATVRLFWEAAYGRQYEIQTSDDGINWTTVYTENNSDGGEDSIYVGNRTARYIKMQGVQRATEWGYSLWEFKVEN